MPTTEQVPATLQGYLAYLHNERNYSPLTAENYARDIRRLLALAGDDAAARPEEPPHPPLHRAVARQRTGRAFAGARALGVARLLWLPDARPRLQEQSLRRPARAESAQDPAACALARRSRETGGDASRDAAGCARQGDVRVALLLRSASGRTGEPRSHRHGFRRCLGARHRQRQQDAHRAAGQPCHRRVAGMAGGARARSPSRTRRRCSSARTARASARARCNCNCANAASNRASPAACIRTCCAIPSPRMCCNPPATCARCRKCWVTPAFPPHRSILTSISNTSPKSTTVRIRVPRRKP